MTTMTFAPMIVLAVVLIAASGIFAFIILRRGKLRDRKTSQFDPSKTSREWLNREAANGKRPF